MAFLRHPAISLIRLIGVRGNEPSQMRDAAGIYGFI